jgi:hypothetical protein
MLAGWDEVVRSNMAKIDPRTGVVNKREDGKVLKPERQDHLVNLLEQVTQGGVIVTHLFQHLRDTIHLGPRCVFLCGACLKDTEHGDTSLCGGDQHNVILDTHIESLADFLRYGIQNVLLFIHCWFLPFFVQ